MPTSGVHEASDGDVPDGALSSPKANATGHVARLEGSHRPHAHNLKAFAHTEADAPAHRVEHTSGQGGGCCPVPAVCGQGVQILHTALDFAQAALFLGQ